jgi:hypothetical protein
MAQKYPKKSYFFQIALKKQNMIAMLNFGVFINEQFLIINLSTKNHMVISGSVYVLGHLTNTQKCIFFSLTCKRCSDKIFPGLARANSMGHFLSPVGSIKVRNVLKNCQKKYPKVF